MSASSQAGGHGQPGKSERLTIEDIGHMLGDIGSGKIAAILKLEPTQEELEEAIAWTQGETRTMSEAHHHLTGRVARNLGGTDETLLGGIRWAGTLSRSSLWHHDLRRSRRAACRPSRDFIACGAAPG